VAGCCADTTDPTVTNASAINKLRMVLNITALLSGQREPVGFAGYLGRFKSFRQETKKIVLYYDN
jgi:hypothetical protein